MPPINACDPNCDTDEDSGNEEVNINNLPGNQLLAETDVEVSSGSFSDSSEQEWEEDLVPLSHIVAKIDLPEKKKTYACKDGVLNHTLIHEEWSEPHLVQDKKSPLQLFELFFILTITLEVKIEEQTLQQLK